MNHDYTHCMDYSEDCPEHCFRAQLAKDLKPGMVVSFSHLINTDECLIRSLPIPKLEDCKVIQQVDITPEAIDKIADAVISKITNSWEFVVIADIDRNEATVIKRSKI